MKMKNQITVLSLLVVIVSMSQKAGAAVPGASLSETRLVVMAGEPCQLISDPFSAQCRVSNRNQDLVARLCFPSVEISEDVGSWRGSIQSGPTFHDASRLLLQGGVFFLTDVESGQESFLSFVSSRRIDWHERLVGPWQGEEDRKSARIDSMAGGICVAWDGWAAGL